jgi:ribokinase
MTPLGSIAGWSREALARRRGPIVVAGNLSLDDTINPTTETLDAPGGDALYASIGARLWGAQVKILTLVGEDYPVVYLEQMTRLGIETDLIRRVPGPTVHYRVVDDEAGTRTYSHLTIEDRLAATSPQARDYASAGDWAWLHLAAMPIEHQQIGIEAARRSGVPASLDPHEEYVRGHESTIRELVAGTAVMPSELEISLLFPDLVESSGEVERAEAAGERLEAWAALFSAVKIGAAGSVVTAGRSHLHVPALDVPVVDRIGAGDAYCGGFVAGLLRTGSLLAAAVCGTVSAADVISHVGAFGNGAWPSREALLGRAATILADRFGDAGDVALDRIRSGFKIVPA